MQSYYIIFAYRILNLKIRNRAYLDKFGKKYVDSAKAMQKFIDIVEEAQWHNLK